MFLKILNDIIEISIITNSNAVESNTVNTKAYTSELRAYGHQVLWKLEVLALINKNLYPVINTGSLMLFDNHFSHQPLLCEDFEKYIKGML